MRPSTNRTPHLRSPPRTPRVSLRVSAHRFSKAMAAAFYGEKHAHPSIASDPVTLTRFLLSEPTCADHRGLAILMQSVQLACKAISQAVRKAGAWPRAAAWPRCGGDPGARAIRAISRSPARDRKRRPHRRREAAAARAAARTRKMTPPAARPRAPSRHRRAVRP